MEETNIQRLAELHCALFRVAARFPKRIRIVLREVQVSLKGLPPETKGEAAIASLAGHLLKWREACGHASAVEDATPLAEEYARLLYQMFSEEMDGSLAVLTHRYPSIEDAYLVSVLNAATPGRKIERSGEYRRITLEIRDVYLLQIDASCLSRREYIEKMLEEKFSEGN